MHVSLNPLRVSESCIVTAVIMRKLTARVVFWHFQGIMGLWVATPNLLNSQVNTRLYYKANSATPVYCLKAGHCYWLIHPYQKGDFGLRASVTHLWVNSEAKQNLLCSSTAYWVIGVSSNDYIFSESLRDMTSKTHAVKVGM